GPRVPRVGIPVGVLVEVVAGLRGPQSPFAVYRAPHVAHGLAKPSLSRHREVVRYSRADITGHAAQDIARDGALSGAFQRYRPPIERVLARRSDPTADGPRSGRSQGERCDTGRTAQGRPCLVPVR